MNYEPLLERDLDAIPGAAHAFLETHTPEELWKSVTRFAVLAYAPSQHAKRAVMACRAAYEVREAMGDRWVEMIIACARYAAMSRPPWSEPPIFEPVAEDALRQTFHGDALLMLDTANALLPLLGEQGRDALFRMPLEELKAAPDAEDEIAPLDSLINDAVIKRGSVDAVYLVLIAIVNLLLRITNEATYLEPYDLARDYAQTLIAHAFARRLPPEQADALLSAVHRNLEEGESYAEWSFA